MMKIESEIDHVRVTEASALAATTVASGCGSRSFTKKSFSYSSSSSSSVLEIGFAPSAASQRDRSVPANKAFVVQLTTLVRVSPGKSGLKVFAKARVKPSQTKPQHTRPCSIRPMSPIRPIFSRLLSRVTAPSNMRQTVSNLVQP